MTDTNQEKPLAQQLIEGEISTTNPYIIYHWEIYKRDMDTAQQTQGKIQELSKALGQLQETLSIIKGHLSSHFEAMDFWLKRDSETMNSTAGK